MSDNPTLGPWGEGAITFRGRWSDDEPEDWELWTVLVHGAEACDSRPATRADVLAALGYDEGEPWCWVHDAPEGGPRTADDRKRCTRWARYAHIKRYDDCQWRPLLVPVEDADE